MEKKSKTGLAYPHMSLPQIFPAYTLTVRGQTGYKLGTTSPTLKPVAFFFFNLTELAVKKAASEDIEVTLVTPPGVRKHS